MIAGEGGWRPGEAQDARFPKIDGALHRDYSMAVFNWFSSGRLSDGEPLPDYLFAYCPWLLSDPTDPAAWFDSRSGDLTLTTQAAAGSPEYRRRFSNVRVRDHDLLHLQPMLLDQCQDVIDLVTGIDHHGFMRALIADDGAVALQRAHGNYFVDHKEALSF